MFTTNMPYVSFKFKNMHHFYRVVIFADINMNNRTNYQLENIDEKINNILIIYFLITLKENE